MALKSFKDLLAWQKARDFSLHIYGEFATCKDFGFKDQIQRASISISNNVAEGYGRRSDKALANFLTIARGSAAEVESMLFLALDLKYIDRVAYDPLAIELDTVSKLPSAFINKIREASS